MPSAAFEIKPAHHATIIERPLSMNTSHGTPILTAPTLGTDVAATHELVVTRRDANAAPEDDVLYDPADDLIPPPKPVDDGPAIPSTTLVVASG
jgi:hypothetical protein